jgi:hypothetical protein
MENHITDQPPGPWGDRPPWKLPGGFRRDCEPHRANLLWRLGCGAEIAGALSFVGPLVIVAAPVALILGPVVHILAKHDLARMGRGLMDPAGRDWTEQACGMGVVALGLAIGATTSWGAIVTFLVAINPRS